jgi:RNA polymerase sigma-70 factor (ECF subfamily)
MNRSAPTDIDQLIEDHSDRAYAAAYRLTGNQTDAWDLVQETFLRALQKAENYDPAFDFGGWLHRLLYRVYLNRRRSQGRRREVPLDPAAGDWRASSSESPEHAAQRSETQDRIAGGLARLPEDMRACLVLVDVEGRSYEEAADILDWPVGSVAGRLFRARRLLRGWLLKDQMGELP